MSSDTSRLKQDNPSALAAGTRLGEFELLSLLGVGGFGIVYLAFDHALEREVAIKEYMPASLAGRTETMRVSVRSHSDAESFALGLKSFVNEAKLLARFDHPSLLKVLRFWEANGTAYMAMPVMRGRTLKEMRQDMAAPPDEAWVRRILLPLLGAVEKLHSEGVYHRDIAPDNIQIEPDGRPVLLDFGAARRVLSDKSQALTAILKPAYAPIEQYGEAGSVKQGPWTDLYALGATLHYLLLGRPPPPATARAVHDDASELTPAQLPGCSESFLLTIDWMLCPRPIDRPQSVAQLRDVIEGRVPAPQRRPAEAASRYWERTNVLPHNERTGRIDLDVGDEATQLVPPRPTAAGFTEHVWIEPDRAQPITGVYRAPKVAHDQGPVSELEMTAQRGPALGAGQAEPVKRRAARLPLALAAVVAVAVAAGAVWWPREGAAPAVAAPAPVAASAVAVPAAVAASAAAALEAPTAIASAPATATALPEVVVPPSQPIRTVELPAQPRVDKPKPLPATAAALKPALEPSKPRTEPATRPPPPAAIAEPAVSTGPGPDCGTREGIRYHVCMERECARSDFHSHSSCQRWRQDARKE